MLRLDSTLRKIEILLGGVVASNQLAFVASWSDATTTSYSGGATPGVTSDTTPVTVVDAPGAGVVRDVDYVSVVNRDTFASVVTLQYNNNGVTYPIVIITLEVGSQLVYTHGSGWNVIDASGSFKTGIMGPPGVTGAGGPAGPAVYLVGEAGIDGLDGVPGKPGIAGIDGATGALGPTGPAVFLVADDPEEPSQGVPGPRGPTGATGDSGPSGPAIFLTSEEPETAEAGPPGRTGIDGVQGTQGPVGPVIMWDYPDEPDAPMLGGGTGGTSNTPTLTLSFVRVETANGYGSTNNKIPRFTTTRINTGPSITYADSATAGSSFTLNNNGIYTISYCGAATTAANMGISINSSQLTTSIVSINIADKLAAAVCAADGYIVEMTATRYCSTGDVIRPHNDGNALYAGTCIFTILQLS